MLLLLATAGCEQEPPSLTVGRILLSLPPQYDDKTADRDSLRQQVASRVADTPRIKYAPNARDAAYLATVTSEEVIELPGSGEQLRPVRVKLQALRGGPEFSAVGHGLPLTDIGASTLTGCAWTASVATGSVRRSSGWPTRPRRG